MKSIAACKSFYFLRENMIMKLTENDFELLDFVMTAEGRNHC